MERFKKIKITKSYYSSIVILLAVMLLLSIVAAISMGAVRISFSDTYRVILGKLFQNPGMYSDLPKSMVAIIWNMRMPRVLLGLVAGAGLALCGCVMQATVNNPISEPYILGVSSGATFGATLLIVLQMSTLVSIGAFLGAFLATVLVLMIASKQGRMTTTRLILAGTVVNALFSAFSNFIISVGANADSVMTIKFWTMGSLANADWGMLGLPSMTVLISFGFFMTQYRIMNTMMLGDETAVTLGINLSFYRKIYMGIIAVITGVLVSSCGIIGFVGLIIPHIARAVVGTNHKRLTLMVSLLGALFLIWADVFARILIQNTELPIGIFTAVAGAPLFIYIVAKKNYGKD